MELNKLIGIMERGEGVICRRFAHESPLHFSRIAAIIPAYDKRGEPDFLVICENSVGCQCTVSAAWISPLPVEGGGVCA